MDCGEWKIVGLYRRTAELVRKHVVGYGCRSPVDIKHFCSGQRPCRNRAICSRKILISIIEGSKLPTDRQVWAICQCLHIDPEMLARAVNHDYADAMLLLPCRAKEFFSLRYLISRHT